MYFALSSICPLKVFTAENMLKYLKVFNFLWRAKRVQYYLSHMWSEQTANYKALHSIKGTYRCMEIHVYGTLLHVRFPILH